MSRIASIILLLPPNPVNTWHTVAVAREGDIIWVHNPEYDYTQYSQNPRVRDVGGTKMVRELIAT
jgi:hypothetical protein